MTVTPFHMLIDTLIPADSDLGMPGISETDFDLYMKQHRLESLCNDFTRMVDQVCQEKYAMSFAAMTDPQRLEAVNACKLVNVRLFSDTVAQLFKAYYSSPMVLAKIKSGSVPPFPHGNALPDDDWSLLESVYERGRIYREVT